MYFVIYEVVFSVTTTQRGGLWMGQEGSLSRWPCKYVTIFLSFVFVWANALLDIQFQERPIRPANMAHLLLHRYITTEEGLKKLKELKQDVFVVHQQSTLVPFLNQSLWQPLALLVGHSTPPVLLEIFGLYYTLQYVHRSWFTSLSLYFFQVVGSLSSWLISCFIKAQVVSVCWYDCTRLSERQEESCITERHC